MNPIIALFSSSLGKKYLMAVTGAMLSLFVLGHMLGNLQIFLHPYFMNSYAYKLQHLPYGLLWVIRAGLLATLVVHVWVAVVLVIENRRARPDRYKKDTTAVASYASRTMKVSGLIVFFFILFHISHYTVRVVPGHEYNHVIKEASGATHEVHVPLITPDGKTVVNEYGKPKEVHNAYAMTIAGFTYWWISLFYIIAMLLLANHLRHGISSIFQSLGLRNSNSLNLLKMVAYAFSFVVFAGFMIIPLSVWAGWLSL